MDNAKKVEEEKVPGFIQKLTSPDELRNVMENAKAKDRMDVYWSAFERLCDLEGRQYNDDLDQDFFAMLAAYEALLYEKNERKTSASRTRQKLQRLGVKKCLEDWAMAKNETPGFLLLVENGKPQFTAEAVVVRHSILFSEEVVASARKRLEKHGIDLALIK